MAETNITFATIPLKELVLRMKYHEDDAQFFPLVRACEFCPLKTGDCQKRFTEVDQDKVIHVNGCGATKKVNAVAGAYVVGSYSSCGTGTIEVHVPGTVSYEAYKRLKRNILVRVRYTKKAAVRQG